MVPRYDSLTCDLIERKANAARAVTRAARKLVTPAEAGVSTSLSVPRNRTVLRRSICHFGK